MSAKVLLGRVCELALGRSVADFSRVDSAHLMVRRVSRCGTFRFKTRQLFLSQALCGEHVALQERSDGVWSFYFYDVLLAWLERRTFKLQVAPLKVSTMDPVCCVTDLPSLYTKMSDFLHLVSFTRSPR